MPALLADANLNRAIVRGLLRRKPELDIVRAQALGFERLVDPDLLDWADREGRVIITHDVQTLPGFAYARLDAGRSFAGVIEVDDQAPIGRVIDDLLLMIEGLRDEEWENRIWYVPM